MSTAPLDLSKPHRPIEVGVLLMGGTTEILDVAPVDMLYSLSHQCLDDWDEKFMDPKLQAQALDINFHWVSEKKAPTKLTGGLNITPTDDFTTSPPLDIVIMGAHDFKYTPNETELAYIRKTYENCSAFIAICGGIQAPLQAGILKGLSATAPRPLLPIAKQLSQDTEWHEKRWHQDGKMWTSGTLLNGNDLMAAFAQKYWGGDDSLAQWIVLTGHWPQRDVNYKDAVSPL